MYSVVISVPWDALAPYGARPSADTALTTKLDIFRLPMYLANFYERYLLSSKRDLAKYRSSSSLQGVNYSTPKDGIPITFLDQSACKQSQGWF